MKQGKHFTASVYIVHDNKVLLHKHKKLNMLLPPGGYLEEDELPHEAAIREAFEEAGLHVTIINDNPLLGDDRMWEVPAPRYLDVILVKPGVEQRDFVFFATCESCILSVETGTKDWQWYGEKDLLTTKADPATIRYTQQAIEVYKKI